MFGDLGQFHNLQPSAIQPTVDQSTATLSADQGVTVVGTGRVPASYAIGGLRLEVPTKSRFSRVSADTPLNTQGLTFGLGYRF